MSKFSTARLLDSIIEAYGSKINYLHGLFDSNRIAQAEGERDAIIAKLRAADALQAEAIKVMGDLALSDDPAFAELNKRIDAYEEA